MWEGDGGTVVKLQWSRADEGAEMAMPRGSTSCVCRGFNGAAPMKARKFSEADADPLELLLLQWSRADEGAEMEWLADIAEGLKGLQWSRADEGAEIARRR